MSRLNSPAPRRRLRPRDYDDFRETLAAPAPRTYRDDIIRTPARPGYTRSTPSMEQIVRIAATILNTLLVVRFIVALFSTDTSNTFIKIILNATTWLVRPFQYLFGTPPSGGSYFDLPALGAIAVITLAAWIISSLVRDYDYR